MRLVEWTLEVWLGRQLRELIGVTCRLAFKTLQWLGIVVPCFDYYLTTPYSLLHPDRACVWASVCQI